MEPQQGDEPIVPFSFMTDPAALKNRAMCYLTYTTPRTHEIILNNLHRAPMYSGTIHGTGARYCPFIEDKVVRFRDKDRHPIFMEPEGLDTCEWYAQGMSTSMPEDVQRESYASIPGLRIEARQKPDTQRPRPLGQASRIPGHQPRGRDSADDLVEVLAVR